VGVLLHLDVKPSNVLLAADGTPMLLDFHLARPPVRPDDPAPDWLGGTPAYMAPEQRAAVHALADGRPLPAAVDAGADIYALGLLLHEALDGPGPSAAGAATPRLDRLNPAVSRGLADLVAKCLADDPRRRYASAADLASDLRRHIQDLPLQGVRNRWGERWQKWCRREPRGLRHIVTSAGLLAVAVVAVSISWVAMHKWQQADTGMKQAEARERAVTEYREAVRNLHELAAQLRFASADPQLLAGPANAGLDARCRSAWEQRRAILDRLEVEPMTEQTAIQTDLLDLALLWADRLMRLGTPAARQEATRVRDEANALPQPTDPPARHYIQGRSYYQADRLARADEEFRAALRLDPHGLRAHFYHGICAYHRRKYEEAILAFTACAALAPEPNQVARCLYNRAMAAAADGRTARALADYDLALEYDPGLGVAALNRAWLEYQAQRYAEALADLRRAEERGANPTAVCYTRAVVQEARGDWAAARASAEDALRHDPAHAEARSLRDRLRPLR
jgi:tetratricopeptide (TPR) repeat protein